MARFVFSLIYVTHIYWAPSTCLPCAGAGDTVADTGMLTLSAPPECKGIWTLNHDQEEEEERPGTSIRWRGEAGAIFVKYKQVPPFFYLEPLHGSIVAHEIKLRLLTMSFGTWSEPCFPSYFISPSPLLSVIHLLWSLFCSFWLPSPFMTHSLRLASPTWSTLCLALRMATDFHPCTLGPCHLLSRVLSTKPCTHLPSSLPHTAYCPWVTSPYFIFHSSYHNL